MIRKEFCSLKNEESEENEKKCKDSHGSDAVSEKFLKTRQIMLYDEIDSDSAEKVIRQLLILEADSDKPIYLFINSPGGSVSSGFAIFDAIRSATGTIAKPTNVRSPLILSIMAKIITIVNTALST